MLLAGVLTPIETVLADGLEWLHTAAGFSWAWAIIALTVIVRLVLVPLTVNQIHSMQRLQAHMPELKAIQTRYKNDSQRKQEETLKYYREHKVNPAASCLPMFLQLPIFFSLFYVLRDFEKDLLPLYPASSLEFLSLVPNITEPIRSHWSGYLLLLLSITGQIASMLFSAVTTSTAQRAMLVLLPLFFAPLMVSFPMGLMLYWLTTSLWTVGQGLVTRRLTRKAPAAALRRTSRAPAGPADSSPAPPAPKAAAVPPRPVRRRKKRGPQARR